MKFSRRSVFLVGLALGLAIWLIPQLILGVREPWDGNGPEYLIALFGSGFLLGLVGPGEIGAAIGGVLLGQVLVLLGRVVASPGTSELWLVGVMFLGGYTLVVTGAGTLLGAVVRRWTR